jgi:hypothetical protein
MKEPDANGVRTRRVAAGVEQAGLTGNFEPESRVDVRPGGAQPNHQAGLVPGALGPDANTGLFGTAAADNVQRGVVVGICKPDANGGMGRGGTASDFNGRGGRQFREPHPARAWRGAGGPGWVTHRARLGRQGCEGKIGTPVDRSAHRLACSPGSWPNWGLAPPLHGYASHNGWPKCQKPISLPHTTAPPLSQARACLVPVSYKGGPAFPGRMAVLGRFRQLRPSASITGERRQERGVLARKVGVPFRAGRFATSERSRPRRILWLGLHSPFIILPSAFSWRRGRGRVRGRG